MAGLDPICSFIAQIPIFVSFSGLVQIQFELCTSFIQILSICHFKKKSKFSFGQVWALKFKFKRLRRFQLRCWILRVLLGMGGAGQEMYRKTDFYFKVKLRQIFINFHIYKKMKLISWVLMMIRMVKQLILTVLGIEMIIGQNVQKPAVV